MKIYDSDLTTELAEYCNTASGTVTTSGDTVRVVLHTNGNDDNNRLGVGLEYFVITPAGMLSSFLLQSFGNQVVFCV